MKYLESDGEERLPYVEFEHKGILHKEPDHNRMLAELLMDDAVFVNTRKYYCDHAKTLQEQTLVIFVVCNDTFAYACADALPVSLKELPELYEMHVQNKTWGSTIWCCYKQNLKPISGLINIMKKEGVWNDKLESLPNNKQ